MRNRHYKIVLIGESDTGKSCIATRFCANRWETHSPKTIGADFSLRTVQDMDLQIWDTAGRPAFRAGSYAFYRKADALVFFYDVTNPQSLAELHNWLKIVKDNMHAEDIKSCAISLAGNKADLQKEVSDEKVQAMLSLMQAELQLAELPLHREISALNGEGVNDLFLQTARRVPDYIPPKPKISEEIEEPSQTFSPVFKRTGFLTGIILTIAAILFGALSPVFAGITVGALVGVIIVAALIIVVTSLAAAVTADRCCPATSKKDDSQPTFLPSTLLLHKNGLPADRSDDEAEPLIVLAEATTEKAAENSVVDKSEPSHSRSLKKK